MPVKRTRRRSSGTRQALASQANTLVLRPFRLVAVGLPGGLRLRVGRCLGLGLFGGSRLRLVAALLLLLRLPQELDRATGCFDLLAGRRRDRMDADRELLR